MVFTNLQDMYTTYVITYLIHVLRISQKSQTEKQKVETFER